MPRSLLFDVKTEFVDIMQSNVDLGDVQVDYGHPGPDQLGPECIWIGETKDWFQDWANIGGQRKKETFSLVVYFLSAAAGKDAQESEDRLGEIFEYAQQSMIDRTNFADLRAGTDGRQLLTIKMTPGELLPMISPNGRVSQITASIEVEGRI